MHYATQDWADYVRGIAPDATAASMQRHLSSGCQSCSRTVTVLRRLAGVATKPEIEVPAFVIHKAKAIFSMPRRSVLARVVFDSFLQPLPAGVRSHAQTVRQAMFQAGDVLVDVRLQGQSDGKVLITGQVANKTTPTRIASGLVLHLVSGAERRRVDANRFGEFQTLYAADRDIRLEISGCGQNIEVPLYRISSRSRQQQQAPARDSQAPE